MMGSSSGSKRFVLGTFQWWMMRELPGSIGMTFLAKHEILIFLKIWWSLLDTGELKITQGNSRRWMWHRL